MTPLGTQAPDGTLLGDRYLLQESIGSGGMASVWLAEDVRLGREVAVKLLSESLAADEAFTARFRREAHIAARLSHPNLVGIFDFDPDADRPYIVMEYVPGPNLATRLERGDPLDADRLAVDLLSALGAIHRADVVHRDVKPANVLIARGGRALLTDFGIARPQDATSITQAGQMPGTARYMAPELMEGEEATPASDLYSFGVLLSQCLAPGAGPKLRDLAERLADPDPGRRPVSADAALADLRTFTAVRPAGATRPPMPFEPDPPTAPTAESVRPRRRGPSPRSRMLAIGAVGGVLALAALAVGLSGGSDPVGDGARSGRDTAASGTAGEDSGASAEDEPAPSGDGGEGVPAPAGEPDVAQAVALNDEGFALIRSGRPEEAVPLLERAVSLFPEGTGDINYAFALFNLGQALNDAGRPDEAIPVLRERLEIPNQTETVQSELDAALAAAGEGGPKPKPPKSKKVPPGQAKK